MTRFMIAAACLIAAPAFADPAKTLGGCELKVAENSGGQNYNKADPTCEFVWEAGDREDKPATKPERG